MTLFEAAAPARVWKRDLGSRHADVMYSGCCSPALSPPAFEQCPRYRPRVRADRPISAIDRSAHDRPVHDPLLDARPTSLPRSRALAKPDGVVDLSTSTHARRRADTMVNN